MEHLITRLEMLASNGWRLPFSSKVLVDADEFLDVMDQLRVALPEEIRQAKKLVQEKEKLLSQARAEAEMVLEKAHQQALELMQENEITKSVEQQAQEIISEAERKSTEIRMGADIYAHEVLISLENEVNRLLATIRRGKAALEKSAEVRSPDEGRTE